MRESALTQSRQDPKTRRQADLCAFVSLCLRVEKLRGYYGRVVLGALVTLMLSACSGPANVPALTPTTPPTATQPAAGPATATPLARTAEPDSTFTPPPGSRGAAVPWIEYEAEAGRTTGAVLEPSRAFGEIAAESSGRRSVRLDATGQYVEFTTTQAANSIVVRYVVPDAEKGGGITATLSLFVNDT